MTSEQLKTPITSAVAKAPVAFFIFNRPEETARVFAAIREARPSHLFVVADGPRHEKDAPLCEAARAVIRVDWPCELQTNYAEKNMGCKDRIASGITWVFEHVDRAIMIEDDCLPAQSFFPYCADLLERYKDEPRVMCIDGLAFQERNTRYQIPYSYHFALVPAGWGWATWRRAWKLYDINIKAWPALRDSGTLKEVMNNPGAYERFSALWDQYYRGEISSWDGQWAFACVANHGLSIHPEKNLISNIGDRTGGTHDKGPTVWHNMPTHTIEFPLTHPPQIVIDKKAEAFYMRYAFGIDKKLRYRLARPIKNLFPNAYKKVRDFFK